MSGQKNAPITLGDKLIQRRGHKLTFVPLIITAPAIGLLAWWASERAEVGAFAALICAVFFLLIIFNQGARRHFLITHDKQGFMASLKLSDKTVIFDGNNIYHFGLDNGRGRKVLAALVKRLRSEGYRVVCFFDANIYHTLEDNGEFQGGSQRFFINILEVIFGLKASEIYIVPSGNQADKFIVESLSHLPVSFAVTNDRFRDYEPKYDFLRKNNQWRKGVKIGAGNLMLYQHKFTPPLKV